MRLKAQVLGGSCMWRRWHLEKQVPADASCGEPGFAQGA